MSPFYIVVFILCSVYLYCSDYVILYAFLFLYCTFGVFSTQFYNLFICCLSVYVSVCLSVHFTVLLACYQKWANKDEYNMVSGSC